MVDIEVGEFTGRRRFDPVTAASVVLTVDAALFLVLAVVGGTAGPTAMKSIRAIRAGSNRASLAFHHRYGFLVDAGQWRARRAQRWEAAHAHNRTPAGS